VTNRVIENPILNGPYDEPARHYRFDDDGITDEIVDRRRPSEYFVPVPQTKKRGAQLQFDNEWTRERIKQNDFVNQVRARVQLWRLQGYPHVTPVTRRLLEHWADPHRENRVLFCQREAAETAIYLVEAAQKDNQAWFAGQLDETNTTFNSGLPRVALKMATGAGKTVVMAMLIAWQTLNKAANPQDKRFGRRFLVVIPGVTIKDRLRVLRPDDQGNYYRLRDLVPGDLTYQLGQAQIEITNYHVFLPKVTKEGVGLAAATKSLLLGDRADADNPFVETSEQVASRVARSFGFKAGEIVVFNDEAHHCYMEKPVERVEEDLSTDERAEAKEETDKARVWFKGLLALQKRVGIKAVYDLSATPFFLTGSGYGTGVLFPWVACDFSLIDAIEAGIVKIPRLPIDDNAAGDQVIFRNLWDEIADELPKRVAKHAKSRSEEPQLPHQLEAALIALYGNYEKAYAKWRASVDEHADVPPVFIVVCNNTTVSKMVFDWIAGYDKDTLDLDGNPVQVVAPGNLDHFSNAKDGEWRHRPHTVLVDSAQLESGDQLSPEFRTVAAREIEEFKAAHRARFPGRDVDEIDEATLLREVMNTVGKKGLLGEQIRCVVSVSMLTEGWDANTVSHILGVRAFRTPLLTEQVVGRGLRRRSYDLNEDGRFDPEYAEIFGVPFAFIPASGVGKDPKPRRAPVRVFADPARADKRITFPRLLGYRLEMPDPDIRADFANPVCHMTVSHDSIPTETHIADVFGEADVVYLAHLEEMRSQEVAFRLAKRLLEREYKAPDESPRPWLFPSVLRIVQLWLSTAVTYDGTFVGLLLVGDLREQAVEKILKGIVSDEHQRRERLLPVFDSTQPEGSTDAIDFDTTRPCEPADPERSHVNYVVVDSGWEAIVALALEAMDEVAAYVKNDGLHFYIPFTHQGRAARYLPDFLVRLTDPGDGVQRTLIVEVSGGAKRHHSPGTVQEKAETTRTLWLPAVNRQGQFGLWDFIEVKDPHTAGRLIRDAARALLTRTRGDDDAVT
jgi:type III restriction enzyme